MTLRTWTGAQFGPQLHVTAGEPPSAAHFRPVTMQDVHRRWYQPSGGFWTSSQTPSGASALIERLLQRGRGAREPLQVWRMQPPSTGQVLVIDTRADLTALRQTFPYGAKEIDYGAIAAAGYLGVHATAAAIDELARRKPFTLLGWDAESTVWLSWVFAEPPQLVPYDAMRDSIEVTHDGAVHRVTYAAGWATRATPEAAAAGRLLWRLHQDGSLAGPDVTNWRQWFLLKIVLELVEVRPGRPSRSIPIDEATVQSLPPALIDVVATALGQHLYDRSDIDAWQALAHLAAGYTLPEHPVALAFVYGSGYTGGWGAVYQCRQCGWSRPAMAPYNLPQMPPCPNCMA